MSVTFQPRASTQQYTTTAATTTQRTQTDALGDDPAKRAAYLEKAKEKYLAAEQLWATNPEESLQTMKELVKKWQTVLRSQDWDAKDQDFKRELTGLIANGLDFIRANEELPDITTGNVSPEDAALYMKSKKKELENIEKNWRTNPDFYGQELVAHYESMSPLLEPTTFASLDPAVAADVVKHMGRIQALSQEMLAGTSTADPTEV